MQSQSPTAGTRPTELQDTHPRAKPIFADMSRRCTTSLEPYLGTYRIVWDSESNIDPRGPFFFEFPPADLHDGVLTLTYPQRSQEWPKEPSPAFAASTAVLHIYDSFLGADRSASKLSPSTSLSPTSSLMAVCTPSSSSSSSSFTDSLPSPPSSSPPSGLSVLSRSRNSSSSTTLPRRTPPTRFWRFDWDPSFPRLGYRFEGMDLTTADGHTLSFSDLLDDHGHPFAVLELRPSGAHRLASAASRDPDYITVVAKRQRDRYSREGLSEAERVRLGMMDLGN